MIKVAIRTFRTLHICLDLNGYSIEIYLKIDYGSFFHPKRSFFKFYISSNQNDCRTSFAIFQIIENKNEKETTTDASHFPCYKCPKGKRLKI